MFSKDINAYTATFRREGFAKVDKETGNMSRRYIKNAIFLILFAALTIAIYTVFLSAKDSIKSNEWKGLVHNMNIMPGDPRHDAGRIPQRPYFDDSRNGLQKPFQENREQWRNDIFHDRNAHVDPNRQWENDILRDRNAQEERNRQWGNDDRNANLEHNGQWGNDIPHAHDSRLEHNEHQPAPYYDADLDNDRQGHSKEDIKQDNEYFPENNDRIELAEVENRHGEEKSNVNDADDFMEGRPPWRNDEATPGIDQGDPIEDKNGVNNDDNNIPKIPDLKLDDIKQNDEKGNFIGYKLFPNGVQPDDDKPEGEKLQNLRRRLGLPPDAPIITKLPVRDESHKRVIPLPHDEDLAGPKKPIDNLGAFNLNLIDKNGDRLPKKFIDVPNKDDPVVPVRVVDNLDSLNIKHRNGERLPKPIIHVPNNDPVNVKNKRGDNFENFPRDRRMNDEFRDGFGNNVKQPQDLGLAGRGRNGRFDNRQVDSVNGNNYMPGFEHKKKVTLRPFGSNRMNPFQLDKQNINNIGRNEINDAIIPNKNFAKDKKIVIRPIGNNGRRVPFELDLQNRNNNLLPNSGGERFNDNHEDSGNYPFERNHANLKENQFDQDHQDAIGNPFARDDQNVGEDLLQNVNFRRPLQQDSQILDKGDNFQHELPQDNRDQFENKGGNLIDQAAEGINDGPVLEKAGQIIDEANEEEQKPLHIEDLSKPLPVTLDCIPFLFPPKRGSLCIHDSNKDSGVSGVIRKVGLYEPDMLAEFFALLNTDPELHVIDIGAGIGVYTLTAALMDRKVVAVEPLSKNYRLLHKSALNNQVSSKITLVAQAIGNKSYKGFLHYSDETGGYGQVRIEKISDDEAQSHDVVQVTTLNNLVQALPFKKALLKIDVGGYMESDVLQASSKFFKALEVPFVLTHWNFHSGVNKKIELATLLFQLGYRPRLSWNSNDADAEALKQDSNFMIWAA